MFRFAYIYIIFVLHTHTHAAHLYPICYVRVKYLSFLLVQPNGMRGIVVLGQQREFDGARQ